MDEGAELELEQARDALTDARVLLSGDGTDAGVVNRLYYAAFHAAQAVLYDCGENPSSHGDVRRLFGQRVVLEGEASREEGRLLGTLYDYRWEADYGGGSPDADITSLFDEVVDFVDHMHDLADDETTDSRNS
jgi:uncharacterized protein (UPF0332 family)